MMNDGSDSPIDDVDSAILQELQKNARHVTAVEIAERIGVSDSTVRNRIEQLEEEGIIQGYMPLIDYTELGFPYQILYQLNVPIAKQSEIASDILGLDHIIAVFETTKESSNLAVVGIAKNHAQMKDLASDLIDMDVTIESERIIRDAHIQPSNHFGPGDTKNSPGRSF